VIAAYAFIAASLNCGPPSSPILFFRHPGAESVLRKLAAVHVTVLAPFVLLASIPAWSRLNWAWSVQDLYQKLLRCMKTRGLFDGQLCGSIKQNLKKILMRVVDD
jgi:hypothetical protein